MGLFSSSKASSSIFQQTTTSIQDQGDIGAATDSLIATGGGSSVRTHTEKLPDGALDLFGQAIQTGSDAQGAAVELVRAARAADAAILETALGSTQAGREHEAAALSQAFAQRARETETTTAALERLTPVMMGALVVLGLMLWSKAR